MKDLPGRLPNDGRARVGLDPRIVEAVFGEFEAGRTPTVAGLALQFPGCEAAIEQALAAVGTYGQLVQRHREQHAPGAGLDLLEPGATLGDFQIVSLIGRGAMGLVYRAKQLSLGGREVALKVLPTSLVATDPRFVERFRREAQLASTVHSPNLAGVYGFGTSDGRAFFAMQLIEGRTLDAVLLALARRSRLGESLHTNQAFVQKAVRLARELAGALGTIHREGLVHRDVKPSNIMLSGSTGDDFEALSKPAVLVDFGLLRPVGETELTGSMTVLGTPAFAAPEARLGRDIDARADVFSLGVVLHDLLTLTRPSERNLAAAGLAGLCQANPSVDKGLAAIIAMATEQRPALRYADGAALADELDRYLAGRPLLALPRTPFGRGWLWVRREPLRAVKLAAICLVVLAFVAGLTQAGVHVGSLYAAASRGARLERTGDLFGAAAAFEQLRAGSGWVALLPGLTDDLEHADDYARPGPGGVSFNEVCAQLAASSEPELILAHEQLRRALLAGPHLPWHSVALQFLERELREGDSPQRRRLAAETAAELFLVHPLAYRAPVPEGGPLDALRTTLIKIAQGQGSPKPNPELRYFATSALSGFTRLDVLAALLPLIEDPDEELSNLAMPCALRIWMQISEQRGLLDIPQELLDSWQAHLARALTRQDRVSLRLSHADQGLQAIAVTLAAHMDAGSFEPRQGPGNELDAYIERLTRTFSDFQPGDAPVRLEPWFTVYGTLFQEAPGQTWDGAPNPFRYPNLWQSQTADSPTVLTNPHPDPQARAAWFWLDGRTPSFQGLEEEGNAAASASWANATIGNDGDAPKGYLELRHSPLSVATFELRGPMPPDVQLATVTVWHGHSARWFLPYAGHASVRITSGAGRRTLLIDTPLDQHALSWDSSPAELNVSGDFVLRIETTSATSTYRLYAVRIDFGPKTGPQASPVTVFGTGLGE